jgi:hypothetical protein
MLVDVTEPARSKHAPATSFNPRKEVHSGTEVQAVGCPFAQIPFSGFAGKTYGSDQILSVQKLARR